MKIKIYSYICGILKNIDHFDFSIPKSAEKCSECDSNIILNESDFFDLKKKNDKFSLEDSIVYGSLSIIVGQENEHKKIVDTFFESLSKLRYIDNDSYYWYRMKKRCDLEDKFRYDGKKVSDIIIDELDGTDILYSSDAFLKFLIKEHSQYDIFFELNLSEEINTEDLD